MASGPSTGRQGHQAIYLPNCGIWNDWRKLQPTDWRIHAARSAALRQAGDRKAAGDAYGEAVKQGGGAALEDYQCHIHALDRAP